MFWCTFFVFIGNTNTPGPILCLVVIIIKQKLLQIRVQASTLLSLRNEGRREIMTYIHRFFPQGPASNYHCKNRQKYIPSKTTQTSGRMGKMLKDRESQIKFN